MALTDLLKNVGRTLTLTAALYNCGGEKEVYPCRTSADCTSGTCVDGYCEGGNGGGNGNGNDQKYFSCQEIYDLCLRGILESGYSDYMLKIRMESEEKVRSYCEAVCDEYSSIHDQPNYQCAVTACRSEVIDCEEHSDFSRENLMRLEQCLYINDWDCYRDSPNPETCR